MHLLLLEFDLLKEGLHVRGLLIGFRLPHGALAGVPAAQSKEHAMGKSGRGAADASPPLP